MIIFKCTCGTLLAEKDEKAGTESVCPECGASNLIPLESEPDCYMIFTQGARDQGFPLSIKDIQNQIHEGTLTGQDLIFYNGQWYPISQVMEVPVPEMPSPNPELKELAIIWEEMPALSGYSPLPPSKAYSSDRQERAEASVFTRKKLKKEGISTNKRTLAPSCTFRSEPAKKSRRSSMGLWLCVCAAVILIAILGIIFPFFSRKSSHKTSCLFIFNKTGRSVAIKVPLLFINEQAYDGQPLAITDIASPFSATFTCSAGNQKLSVLFAPCIDTIINPEKETRFCLYRDLNSISERTVRSLQINDLITTICENRIPEGVSECFEHLHQKITKDVFTGYSQESSYSSQSYNFWELGLNYGGRGSAAPVNSSNPYLCSDAMIALKFKNLDFDYIPPDSGADIHTRMTLTIPGEITYSPDKATTYTSTNSVLQIYFEEGKAIIQLQCTSSRKQGEQTSNGGKWAYRAEIKNGKCVLCQWVHTSPGQKGTPSTSQTFSVL